MKISKIIALATCLCLSASVLSGCGDKEDEKGKADPEKYYTSQPADTGYEVSNEKFVGG